MSRERADPSFPRDPTTQSRSTVTDTLIIGDGIIGLSSALAIARAGGTSCIIGYHADGSASRASAGLLAPSIGSAPIEVRRIMVAARDLYPELVHWLAERTGIDVPLNRRGIIQLTPPAEGASPSNEPASSALETEGIRALEPSLSTAASGVLHHGDGFVDNVRLVEAMREAVRCEWSIEVVSGRAARIEPRDGGWSVFTEDGRRHSSKTVILAAGAWSALVAGVPRPVRVVPVRGQMLSLAGGRLGHAIAGPEVYLVPRGDATIVGSTFEYVGFDSHTTETAIERLRDEARAMVPELAEAAIVDAWAGLRPVTPDGLPIIGQDPDVPSLIYACGHGKNGILLAPITGECVAALAGGTSTPMDLDPFSVARFE
jgi:glycine oxidase